MDGQVTKDREIFEGSYKLISAHDLLHSPSPFSGPRNTFQKGVWRPWKRRVCCLPPNGTASTAK